MIACPKCNHTMTDEMQYCDCCGTYLVTAQPKVRIVSTSTYRLDFYGEPEVCETAPAQGASAFYSMYEPTTQMNMGSATAVAPKGVAYDSPAVSSSARRMQRRSRRMNTLFSVGLVSMLLLGFGGGMTAFANDDAESRMPLVAEYEELVAPEVTSVSFDVEDGEPITILDDPTPMASSPAHSDDLSDFIVDVEPANEVVPEPAPLASALEEPQAEVTIEPLAPCTLEINGVRVPYVHSVFASACPDNNAALWAGSDDTTDGSYGYFVGHNPGDFECVFGLVPGNYVTLCDINGNLRNYTVTQLYDVPDTIFFHEVAERLIPQGESLVMQTCIGDGSYYRIVVCE